MLLDQAELLVRDPNQQRQWRVYLVEEDGGQHGNQAHLPLERPGQGLEAHNELGDRLDVAVTDDRELEEQSREQLQKGRFVPQHFEDRLHEVVFMFGGLQAVNFG